MNLSVLQLFGAESTKVIKKQQVPSQALAVTINYVDTLLKETFRFLPSLIRDANRYIFIFTFPLTNSGILYDLVRHV